MNQFIAVGRIRIETWTGGKGTAGTREKLKITRRGLKSVEHLRANRRHVGAYMQGTRQAALQFERHGLDQAGQSHSTDRGGEQVGMSCWGAIQRLSIRCH